MKILLFFFTRQANLMGRSTVLSLTKVPRPKAVGSIPAAASIGRVNEGEISKKKMLEMPLLSRAREY